ncbi:MAG: type II toxin-antitoxin system Phd/YefM family antitoxin [Magnetococcus sp. DMHC-1]|nr:type II toxin-antitoxin system Phd/YefM family antitoxin [Magnetococcales bacterium]
MIREATVMTVCQDLGELLNEVQYRRDTVLITQDGKPVAAMVNIDLFEKICMMHDEFQQMTNELAFACSAQDQVLVETEIAEAVRAARGR